MKRDAGFSILELMVAVGITLAVVAATLSTMTDANHANEAVTKMADMQENLRAGMNFIVQDLVQAGEGIPVGGIPIPANMDNETPPQNTAALLNRPGPTAGMKFPAVYATLAGVSPGPGLTPADAIKQAGGFLTGTSDIISILYADNTLLLHVNPINSTKNPVCNGTFGANGSSVTFDKNCLDLSNNGNVSVSPGDLIMLSNALGNVLQTVTSVNGQTLNFAAGDAFGLNQTGDPQGTITQIQTTPGSNTYPPTSATRIWMITYYLDNVTDLQRPRLLRRVNFNPAQPVGEVIEDLQVSYDIVDGAGNPASVKQPSPSDSTAQIRKVNLYLAARSNSPYSQSGQFFRSNLLTQVTLRSMAYVPFYN
jgi:hypothetical protein